MAIAKFSLMNEEQKKAYMNYYNNAMLTGIMGFTYLKPEKEFDKDGLRFPSDYLQAVGKSIVMLPLELMAEYVDGVTHDLIDEDNQPFIFEQVINRDINVEEEYPSINATGIGNLAYICLNCKNEKAREITEKILDEIFIKQKGELLEQINDKL